MTTLERLSLVIGEQVARYSLVLFFLGFGALKFTAEEAAAIEPLMANSPFLFWIYAIADRQWASNLIGIAEIALALLIAVRPFSPKLSAIGSFGTALSLVVTLSFLVTTPGIDPVLMSFIVKDLTLLGVAIWTGGEALAAARSGGRRFLLA